MHGEGVCMWGPHFRWLRLWVSEASFGHLEVHRWGHAFPAVRGAAVRTQLIPDAVHSAFLGPWGSQPRTQAPAAPGSASAHPSSCPCGCRGRRLCTRGSCGHPWTVCFPSCRFGKYSHDELSILVPLQQCCRYCPPPCSARCAEPSGDSVPASPASAWVTGAWGPTGPPISWLCL